MTLKSRIMVFLSLAILSCTPEKPPKKEVDHHGDHHNSQAQTLKLNNGAKWATDEVLRTEMERIHELVTKTAEKQKTTEVTASEYKSLGQSIQKSVNAIFKGCKLAPDADQQLHTILAGVLKENSVLKKSSDEAALQGARSKIQDLHSLYLEYFDVESK